MKQITATIAFASGLLLCFTNSAYAQTKVGCIADGDAIVEMPSGKLLQFYAADGPILGDHISKFISFDGAQDPGTYVAREIGTCTVIYK